MRIEIDVDRCEGHGLCEQVAPSVYTLDDDGIVQATDEVLPAGLVPFAEAGARVCPVAALRLVDES